VVFVFLEAFEPDRNKLDELKEHYQRGGLADSVLKRRLNEHLQALLVPIRERRQQFASDRSEVMAILRHGTEGAWSAHLLDCRAASGTFTLSVRFR
jgi:tryptophanyl-tRNA synthetase